MDGVDCAVDLDQRIHERFAPLAGRLDRKCFAARSHDLDDARENRDALPLRQPSVTVSIQSVRGGEGVLDDPAVCALDVSNGCEIPGGDNGYGLGSRGRAGNKQRDSLQCVGHFICFLPWSGFDPSAGLGVALRVTRI